MIALVKGFHDTFKDTTGTHFTGIISVICPTALQNEMVALVSQTRKLQNKKHEFMFRYLYFVICLNISFIFKCVKPRWPKPFLSLFLLYLNSSQDWEIIYRKPVPLKHWTSFKAQHWSQGNIVLGLGVFRTGRLKGLSFICLKLQLPPFYHKVHSPSFLKCRGPFKLVILFSSGWQILLISSYQKEKKAPQVCSPLPNGPQLQQ